MMLKVNLYYLFIIVIMTDKKCLGKNDNYTKEQMK